MKIGIVGLKPKQIADLNTRSFGQIELSFFEDDKKMTADALEIFSRRHDRVLILYPHVPKHAVSRIPASKVHGMSGSVSTLIRYFETLKITQRIEDSETPHSPTEPPTTQACRDIPPLPPEEPSTQPSTVDVVEQFKPTPPNKLGSMVPRGQLSQYQWNPNLSVINPGPMGSHSYELLDIAEPGDIVRYGRPPKIEFEVWKQRLSTVRASRLKSKQQLLEVHFFDTYVDVMVMNLNSRAIEASTESKPATSTDGAASEVKCANLQTVTSKAAKVVELEIDREFWKQIYAVSLGQSGDSEKALSDANLALDRCRERFPAL